MKATSTPLGTSEILGSSIFASGADPNEVVDDLTALGVSVSFEQVLRMQSRLGTRTKFGAASKKSKMLRLTVSKASPQKSGNGNSGSPHLGSPRSYTKAVKQKKETKVPNKVVNKVANKKIVEHLSSPSEGVRAVRPKADYELPPAKSGTAYYADHKSWAQLDEVRVAEIYKDMENCDSSLIPQSRQVLKKLIAQLTLLYKRHPVEFTRRLISQHRQERYENEFYETVQGGKPKTLIPEDLRNLDQTSFMRGLSLILPKDSNKIDCLLLFSILAEENSRHGTQWRSQVGGPTVDAAGLITLLDFTSKHQRRSFSYKTSRTSIENEFWNLNRRETKNGKTNFPTQSAKLKQSELKSKLLDTRGEPLTWAEMQAERKHADSVQSLVWSKEPKSEAEPRTVLGGVDRVVFNRESERNSVATSLGGKEKQAASKSEGRKTVAQGSEHREMSNSSSDSMATVLGRKGKESVKPNHCRRAVTQNLSTVGDALGSASVCYDRHRLLNGGVSIRPPNSEDSVSCLVSGDRLSDVKHPKPRHSIPRAKSAPRVRQQNYTSDENVWKSLFGGPRQADDSLRKKVSMDDSGMALGQRPVYMAPPSSPVQRPKRPDARPLFTLHDISARGHCGQGVYQAMGRAAAADPKVNSYNTIGNENIASATSVSEALRGQ
jgi:hypothetical protein